MQDSSSGCRRQPGRCARDLTGSTAAGAGSSPFGPGHAAGFLDWRAARHDDVPGGAAEAVGTMLAGWGPHGNLDERWFCACSPHRIEMAAHLIRDGYFADDASTALGLLPEWTQWMPGRRLNPDHRHRYEITDPGRNPPSAYWPR